MRFFLWLAGALGFALPTLAQNGTLRGNVFDNGDGAPIPYCSVRLEGRDLGAVTDMQGYFSIGGLAPGKYRLVASYLGYADAAAEVDVKAGAATYTRILLDAAPVELQQVDVSAEREQQRSNALVAQVQVRREEVLAAPAIGGEPDLAQYLSVLPGVVSNGDQGGQLFIRGGAPVQTRFLLDGMTLFNPFHSIGLFSVFETEALRSVDLYTAAFPAQYGGRVSAVMDIRTREGNARRTAGLVSVSPFQVKALVEGPLRKIDRQGNALSFLLTAKQGIIDRTSPQLYPYATDTTFYSFAAGDTSLSALQNLGLPYRYSDVYGKLSWIGSLGSRFDAFGFNFQDAFEVPGIARLSWGAGGGGARFQLVPSYSNILMDGAFSYTNYALQLSEKGEAPRRSGVDTYTAQLNFRSLLERQELRYGFELTGFNTDFSFKNPIGILFSQQDFTTELAAYFTYAYRGERLVLEPGLRVHYYASQSRLSPEPRFAAKYLLRPHLRIKAAGGWYSQNLLGTVNDLDVVNFFVGYLAGPEQTLYQPGTKTPLKSRLQSARHAVVGLEADLGSALSLTLEPYWKDFTQLIQVNRNKQSGAEPDFVTETGDAKGLDFTLKYRSPRSYLWAVYSLAVVNRDDGQQVYPTSYDRRHNLNLLGVYTLDRSKKWEAALRWNLGSGFPFTQTQGFFQNVPIGPGALQTNIPGGNYPIGVILSDQRNGGRLPYYHRLDLSLKRRFRLGKTAELEANASASNVYNRENVFYIDRSTNRKVNQLPILPALGLTGRF